MTNDGLTNEERFPHSAFVIRKFVICPVRLGSADLLFHFGRQGDHGAGPSTRFIRVGAQPVPWYPRRLPFTARLRIQMNDADVNAALLPSVCLFFRQRSAFTPTCC